MACMGRREPGRTRQNGPKDEEYKAQMQFVSSYYSLVVYGDLGHSFSLGQGSRHPPPRGLAGRHRSNVRAGKATPDIVQIYTREPPWDLAPLAVHLSLADFNFGQTWKQGV